MLTEHERNLLVDDYHRRPVSVTGALLTCAGGLLVVILLAYFGFDMQLFSPTQHEQTTALRPR